MSPKITQNGSSLQIIIPKTVCESKGLKAGDEMHITTDGEVISMTKHDYEIEEDNEKCHTVFTIGYEGRTPEKFIARLKMNGVKQVIDVREIPLSRKKGFSKKALMHILEDEGIMYVHIPELGSPSDIRHDLKNGGSETMFFQKYEEYVDKVVPQEIDVLDEYASTAPSALMCFEMTFVHCHRKILANKLSNRGYRVIHL